VPLHKRENWRRDVANCCMMRRANFSFLRYRVIIIIKPIFRSRLITNPCGAPAGLKSW
jgi:hypothetical protein